MQYKVDLFERTHLVFPEAKVESVFGTVELKETRLDQFYSSHQKDNEDISMWGCRLDDMLMKSSTGTGG